MDPQQLLDTSQALSSQVQALQAEVQSLRQNKTEQQQPFPQTGAAASMGDRPTTKVDLTKLGKSPKQFEGTAESWESFRFNFTTYIGTVDPRLPELLDDAARRPDPIDMSTALTQTDRNKAIEFYAVLNGSEGENQCSQYLKSPKGPKWFRGVETHLNRIRAARFQQTLRLVKCVAEPHFSKEGS